MKSINTIFFFFLIVLVSCEQKIEKDNKTSLTDAQLIGNEIIETNFGDIELKETYIAEESIQLLKDQLALQRAIEVYQWSLPLTTFGMWYKAHYDIYQANDLDFVEYVSFEEKIGVVTGNSSTPYVITWVDLSRTGPIVIDYPAGPSAGSILNFFQLSISDLGFVGPDKGEGGKYLVIPPTYDASKLDTKGYFLVNASTNKLMIGTRFLSPDPQLNDRMKASFLVGKYGEDLEPAKFISKTDKRFRGHPYRGLQYFESLHEVIQNEPVAEEDKIFNTYMIILIH